MELKNALAVCLISLFSATLVVLIARSLDSQAASRLEPQLTKIAEKLEAIRKQGGLPATSGDSAASEPDNALMVYYYHGERCASCRAAESNALSTLQAEYAPRLESGEIVWKVLDYRTDPMAKDFGVVASTIVLVRRKGGEIAEWNHLDRVLALAKDKPALSAYLQEEINAMLATAADAQQTATPDDGPAIPVPDDEPDALPVPDEGAEIPIPESDTGSPIN